MNHNREPMFVITTDDYSPLGVIVVEGDRWIGRTTTGAPMFDRKDQSGAVNAAKSHGNVVSSAWYGVPHEWERSA